jgi:phage shock protein PspC (stress-responsive transcriptional regulator)
MIRITGGTPPEIGAAYQIVVHLTRFKCCAAISHLQHKVQIPKSWVRTVGRIPIRSPPRQYIALKEGAFTDWHASCSVVAKSLKEFPMTAQQSSVEQGYTPLPLRAHTILGVCEALGEDFGFNPVFLRIPLAACVIWSPAIAFGTYFGLGALVLLSRLLFPTAKAGATAQTVSVSPANEQRELAKAA